MISEVIFSIVYLTVGVFFTLYVRGEGGTSIATLLLCLLFWPFLIAITLILNFVLWASDHLIEEEEK